MLLVTGGNEGLGWGSKITHSFTSCRTRKQCATIYVDIYSRVGQPPTQTSSLFIKQIIVSITTTEVQPFTYHSLIENRLNQEVVSITKCLPVHFQHCVSIPPILAAMAFSFNVPTRLLYPLMYLTLLLYVLLFGSARPRFA